jgi:hypothetical protein
VELAPGFFSGIIQPIYVPVCRSPPTLIAACRPLSPSSKNGLWIAYTIDV